MIDSPASLHFGNALEVLKSLPNNSVDAIVTDPPYGLAFMGKGWDHAVPGVAFWSEFLRLAKPGANLLAFGGTRTFHRLAVAIEDAGWEIRDTLMWVYGSGFPKSHDVSKAIDREAGAEREVVGRRVYAGGHIQNSSPDKLAPPIGTFERAQDERTETAPATSAASQWQGWGTALKPAWEPIIVARKPLAGTVAANVLRYGTGGINIDGCRVEGVPPSVPQPSFNSPTGRTYGMQTGEGRNGKMSQASGRWPANLIHDGSPEVLAGFPEQKSPGTYTRNVIGHSSPAPMNRDAQIADRRTVASGFGDSGSAARFFYCAKASRAERGEGNAHPTVKPLALMRYLCRLVTPPAGLILDPFAGSGSTGIAAKLEGFRFLGVELEPAYLEIARARIEAAGPEPSDDPQMTLDLVNETTAASR